MLKTFRSVYSHGWPCEYLYTFCLFTRPGCYLKL